MTTSMKNSSLASDIQCQDRDLGDIIQILKHHFDELTKDKKEDFAISQTSVVMMSIAAMGFVINVAAAIFLTLKMKTNGHSPFLR